MKNNYFFLLCLTLVSSISFTVSVYSLNLTGAEICKDAFIAPYLRSSDSYPTKHHALVCINPRVELHHYTLGANLITMLFSKFSETGNPTGLQSYSFHCLADFKTSRITTGMSFSEPIVCNWVKQKVITMHQGEAYAFVPKTNLNNTLINWSVYQSDGELKHYFEKGRILNILPFELRGKQPANIMYASVPTAPAYLVAAYRNFL
jgi:hypothetical protein